jgi:beta-lactamase regulating signal transducer with metallopeptidase domain
MPQSVAVNVQWLAPLQTNINQVVANSVNPSWFSKISLNHALILMSLVGLFILTLRLHKHYQWVNELRNNSQNKLVTMRCGHAIYQSNQINNALLIGYKSPSIWVNSQLVKSPYFEIIIEHELTHIKHKDNYWLVILAFINAIYWWNPLIKILIENIKEHLETRCDNKASQSFTQGFYHQKLTELILSKLMLNQQPVIDTGFASAVISKNSNIRRLKTLKEKQTMNLFSKLMVSALLVSGITVLTLPISSLNSFASNYSAEKVEDEPISLNFQEISISDLATILADALQLEAVISDSVKKEIVSIQLKSYPRSKLLNTLSTTLNISFIQKGNQLLVTSLPGSVINNFETYDTTKGVMLDLNIKKTSNKEGKTNTKTTEASIWTHYSKPGIVNFNDLWEVEIIANEQNKGNIYLEIKLFSITNANSKILVAEPKLVVVENKMAAIEFEDKKGSSIYFTVTANKMQSPLQKS